MHTYFDCVFRRRSHLRWDVYFGWDMHFGMHILGSHLHFHFGCNAHILEEICIWGNTLYLHFSCNAHILEDVHAFGGSQLHFDCNAHLYRRRCILKYNYIHMSTEEMTLIKHYCNLYYISSRIEENKTNFTSWIHEPHSNSIISYFRWDVINQT